MKKTNKNNNHKFLSKNYIKGAISGALALTILCSGVGVAAYSAGADNTAQALGVQTESTVEAVKKASTTKEALKKLSKNETVYVIADASGAAKKIIVSDWLKGVDTKGKVKDVSKLKDVKNVKGDETYTVNEDNAYEWAANGDDIYYQGTGTTELPVKLKLSYKLNGKTVSADEIAGKSGKVTIRIDYENTQKEKVKINGKTQEVNVPFLMLSGMILDDDKFKNVEVSNGKAINDGTRTIVAGFALPGMQDSLDIDKDEMEIPDYVEITADTTDFELSTTMTVAMNDIFNDVDFSKVDDKVDELKDSLDELEDAAEQLVDGSSQLYDGSKELGDGMTKLEDGSDTLATSLGDGAAQVKETKASDDTISMFATPITDEETKITTVENNGHAMAPYMMSVGLWVGCLAFCLMYPLTEYKGKLKSGFAWWASKASVLYPVAILQGVLLILLLHVFDGFTPVEMTKTILFAALTGACFTSIMYFFNITFGKVGSFLMLIFMVVQLAGSAGTYPVEISPDFVAKIHYYLPFTYTVNAFRSTICGGESIHQSVVVLIGLTIIFSILTILQFNHMARRKKQGKMLLLDWLEEKGVA